MVRPPGDGSDPLREQQPSVNDDELYPTAAWPDPDRVDFFHGRFTPGPVPWIDDHMRARRKDGTLPPRGTMFWLAARARAREMLGREEVEPGVDYALTEVVHCKSDKELGVAKALPTCVATWLQPLLQLAAARVVALLGSRAQRAFLDLYPDLGPGAFSGPQLLEGRPRIVLQLPHPNARVRRANSAPLTSGQLAAVRDHLGALESRGGRSAEERAPYWLRQRRIGVVAHLERLGHLRQALPLGDQPLPFRSFRTICSGASFLPLHGSLLARTAVVEPSDHVNHVRAVRSLAIPPLPEPYPVEAQELDPFSSD
jgi:hypothetical protein